MNVEAGQPGSGTIEVIARPARTWALYFVLPLIVLPRAYIDGNLVGGRSGSGRSCVRSRSGRTT